MSFGLYSALMPRRPVTHQLSLISFTTCCGALMLVPFSIWEYSTGATLKFDALTLATLAYVADLSLDAGLYCSSTAASR